MKSVLGSIPHSQEKQNKTISKNNCGAKLLSSNKAYLGSQPVNRSPANIGLLTSNVSQNPQGSKKCPQKNVFPDMKDVSSIQKLVKKHYISNVDLNCSMMKFKPLKGAAPIKYQNANTKLICSILNDSSAKVHKVSTNSQAKSIGKIKSPSNCKSNDTFTHSQDNSDIALKNRLVKDIKKSRNSANMNKIVSNTKQCAKKMIPSASNLFSEVIRKGEKATKVNIKACHKFLDLSLAKNDNDVNNLSHAKNTKTASTKKFKTKDIHIKCNYDDLTFLSNYKPTLKIMSSSTKPNTQSAKILSPKSNKTNNSTFRKMHYNTQELEKSQLHHYKHAVSKQLTQCITSKNSCNEDDTQMAEVTGIMIDMNNGSTFRIHNTKMIAEETSLFDHNFKEKPIKLQGLELKPSYTNINENINEKELINQSSLLIRKENPALGRNIKFTKENLNSLMSMKIEGPEEFHFIQVKMEIRYTKELAYKFEHLEEIKRENQNGVLMEQYDSDEDIIVN